MHFTTVTRASKSKNGNFGLGALSNFKFPNSTLF